MSVDEGGTGRRSAGPRIFLSYRRDDSSGYAVHLYDNLAERFGAESVFMDVDSLAPGVDFVEAIQETLQHCDTVLVLIGRGWLSASGSDGRRRLDDPEDFVRLEVEAALAGVHQVVPVLVAGAEMPSRAELPASLAALARRHAVDISDRRWRADSESLMDALERGWVRAQTSTPKTPATSAVPSPPEPVKVADEVTLLVPSEDRGGLTTPVPPARPKRPRPGPRAWIAIGTAVVVVAAVVLAITLSGSGGQSAAFTLTGALSETLPASSGYCHYFENSSEIQVEFQYSSQSLQTSAGPIAPSKYIIDVFATPPGGAVTFGSSSAVHTDIEVSTGVGRTGGGIWAANYDNSSISSTTVVGSGTLTVSSNGESGSVDASLDGLFDTHGTLAISGSWRGCTSSPQPLE